MKFKPELTDSQRYPQGHSEIIIGRVNNVDGRHGDGAPVSAARAAAAGAQCRCLAQRLSTAEDRSVYSYCVCRLF